MIMTKSKNFYANTVKVLLLIVIGIGIANQESIRYQVSDSLYDTADYIRP